MFERFTAEARQTVVLSQEHAVRREDSTITPTHLLLALTEGHLSDLLSAYGLDVDTIERLAPGNKAREIPDDTALRSIGVDLHAIRESVESAFGPGALETGPGPRRRFWARTRRGAPGRKMFAANAKNALVLSLRETIRLNVHEIADESLLLGLLRTDGPEITAIFEHIGLDQANLRNDLESRIRKAA